MFILTKQLITCLSILFFSMSVVLAVQQKQENTTISGKITVNGSPTAGIFVSLSSSGQVKDKAKTDSDGQYTLTAQGAGNYLVVPYTPNFAGQPAKVSKELKLLNGEKVSNINFDLEKGGVITGRVTYADGKPLIEVFINVYKKDDQGNVEELLFQDHHMARTDDRGVYRLFGLQPGKYIISIGGQVKTNFIGAVSGKIHNVTRSLIPLTYFPSVDRISNATTVELKDSEEVTNIDITASAPSKLYTISGHIIEGTSGRTLANIRYGYSYKGQDFPHYEVYTNAHGEFCLSGLPPGKYNVFSIASDKKNSYSEKVSVEVTDHDVNNIDIKLYQAVTISGIINVEGAEDVDIRSELTKLGLFAYSPAISGANNQEVVGQVGADGTFVISGISPGQFTLGTSRFEIGTEHTEFRRSKFSLLRIEKNGSTINNNFEAQAGEKLTDLCVVVAYGKAIIQGTVKINDTIKINGITPSFEQCIVSYECINCEGVKRKDSVSIDTRGNFNIQGLLPGDYDISLIAYDIPNSLPISLAKRRVTISRQQVLDITLIGELNSNTIQKGDS